MTFNIEWIERKARVSRRCRGLAYAQSCGAAIDPGVKFYQYKNVAASITPSCASNAPPLS